MATFARTLLFGTAAALALVLAGPVAHALDPGTPPAGRVVYLARNLPDEALVVLGAALAARGEDSVLLLDSDARTPSLRSFLEDFHPDRVVPVGSFSDGGASLEKRLGVRPAPAVAWTKGPPLELWRAVLGRTESVVVCPAAPRALLLQAACLAGALPAPLFVSHGDKAEAAQLREALAACHATRVYLIGRDDKLVAPPSGLHRLRLADEEAVAAAYRRLLREQGKSIASLVVANPSDTAEGLDRLAPIAHRLALCCVSFAGIGPCRLTPDATSAHKALIDDSFPRQGPAGRPVGLSALAPWVAVRKRAALVLTGSAGTDVEAVVARAVQHESLRRADSLLLLANLEAIPWQRRPNPLDGKEAEIEMEPLTPGKAEPCSFATGRLFHEDPAVVPLMLARQRLLADTHRPHKALVVSNPGGGLSLLETFSRNTASELSNAGFQTTTRFGSQVQRDELRRLLPEHQVFLWEGHSSTLMREYDFPSWTEPLPPSLVFLQSCLALTEVRAAPLLGRGAVAVVGTSTRTYSGSGGACSLAFFNALLYDGQSLGGALRQAKNFLLAYALLKEKRLGKDAPRSGANLRAAWAFTLWGDPTLQLPPPERPASARPAVRHEVLGNTIVLDVPREKYDPVQTDKYQAAMPANARLAGLLRKEKNEDDRKPLVPLVFAEVHLPRARAGRTPSLTSRLPSNRWVFCWDERRRCGYLLASPRPQDTGELRFHVHWQEEVGKNTTPAGLPGR
jgi:hypothetical protein